MKNQIKTKDKYLYKIEKQHQASSGSRIWNEHIRFSSTLIIAPRNIK